uniref:NADH dehydrogenase subunit 4L n=1 Tax=Xylocopa appendiculata TaxID=135683 RepID=A0A343DRE9_9HYME|nr:NADH dehydrogenase subunit 4L [Xylocopa appendiculata]
MSMLLILNLFFMMLMLFSSSKHFLNFLIYMEFMVVSILFYMIMFKLNMWFFLVYMVYSVCESVLGLSLLVSMNFEYGHEKIYLINLC